MRIPRIHARPPMIPGPNVMRSNTAHPPIALRPGRGPRIELARVTTATRLDATPIAQRCSSESLQCTRADRNPVFIPLLGAALSDRDVGLGRRKTRSVSSLRLRCHIHQGVPLKRRTIEVVAAGMVLHAADRFRGATCGEGGHDGAQWKRFPGPASDGWWSAG